MKIKPIELTLIDKSVLSRPIILNDNMMKMLIDTGAQVCVWYGSLLSLRNYYNGIAGKAYMTDAGKNVTPVLSMLCDIPFGGVIFKNVPVSYNPKIRTQSKLYNMLIGTCIIKNCKIMFDLHNGKLWFIPNNPCVESGVIYQESVQEPGVNYINMSISDLFKMQKDFGSAVAGMSLDKFIDTVGIDAVMQYVESQESNELNDLYL